MKIKLIYNISACKLEEATLETCRRCRGFGSNLEDAREDKNCCCCNGYGLAWFSGNGAVLPYRSHANKSEIYY